MDIKLKTGPQGHIYLPKNIRTHWGLKFNLTPNWKAGIFYPSDAKPKDVLKSLETLTLEFQHRVELEASQNEPL